MKKYLKFLLIKDKFCWLDSGLFLLRIKSFDF